MAKIYEPKFEHDFHDLISVEGSEITLELTELGQLTPAITGYLSSGQVGQHVRFVKEAAMPKEGM